MKRKMDGKKKERMAEKRITQVRWNLAESSGRNETISGCHISLKVCKHMCIYNICIEEATCICICMYT